MIIWLASYPRSGNTLFRTICRHCFGLYSYADEPVDYESNFRSNPDLIGHVEYPESWEEFYSKAIASSEVFLVKTHNYPIDNQAFIYIVRDGRSSIQSYRKFHQSFNRIDKSLVSIILGNDHYGDWSTHYEKWNNRDVKHLLVRFEDLIDIKDDRLAQIADFIHYKGKIKKWENPVKKLQTYEPNFFNQKNRGFKPGKEWTRATDYIFNKQHHQLMADLQYNAFSSSLDQKPAPSPDIDFIIDELIILVKQLQNNNNELMGICKERKTLIDKLHDICEERLDIINKFHHSDEKI
ncbi:MAG: sulfotransferase [Desulfobacteraceae bacterium]|nr:sulfotransferase domain-containing protein [Desulfobacteraceae bacterium]MBC2754909.1 sulfotransferase [Desulfobacteraceae bacterium]